MEARLRDEISGTHPVIGDGWRLVEDHEALRPGDETACVSCLLSLDGDRWADVIPGWAAEVERGTTVGEILGPDSPDADAGERLFRRRVP